jgi:hypothetical protein
MTDRESILWRVLLGAGVMSAPSVAEIIGGSSDSTPPPFWEDSFWWIISTIEKAFPFTTPSYGPFTVEELGLEHVFYRRADSS